MSYLKLKSDENLYVAQELTGQGRYNTSVHCSYYGCFQFMKCLLCYNLGISYDEQDGLKGSDTHDYIFNLFQNRIYNPWLLRSFRIHFLNLKHKRGKADYKNEIITEEESLTAIEEAKMVIAHLTSVFGALQLVEDRP